jgi:hypothetical protein
MRGVGAAVVWVGLNIAAWSRMFEPLPDVSLYVWLGPAAAATFEAGLLARRWPAITISPPVVASAVGFTSQSDGARRRSLPGILSGTPRSGGLRRQ